jgi:hypothetical protein
MSFLNCNIYLRRGTILFWKRLCNSMNGRSIPFLQSRLNSYDLSYISHYWRERVGGMLRIEKEVEEALEYS